MYFKLDGLINANNNPTTNTAMLSTQSLSYLFPSNKDFYNPFLFEDMQKSVDLINNHINQQHTAQIGKYFFASSMPDNACTNFNATPAPHKHLNKIFLG